MLDGMDSSPLVFSSSTGIDEYERSKQIMMLVLDLLLCVVWRAWKQPREICWRIHKCIQLKLHQLIVPLLFCLSLSALRLYFDPSGV